MKRMLTIVLLSAFVISSVLYYFLGAAPEVLHYWQQQSNQRAVAAAMQKIHSPQQVIAELKQHLKTNPSSAKGWYLLGSLYSDLHEYYNAKTALIKAHHLQPDNLLYSASLVEVNFFRQHGRLSSIDMQNLTAILKKEPDNVVALNLIALDAYHRHTYAKAVTIWQRLLTLFPAASDERQMLLKMIAKAQQEEFHAG